MFGWAPFFNSTCLDIWRKDAECDFHEVESPLFPPYSRDKKNFHPNKQICRIDTPEHFIRSGQSSFFLILRNFIYYQILFIHVTQHSSFVLGENVYSTLPSGQ